jgi:hypothetical protein
VTPVGKILMSLMDQADTGTSLPELLCRTCCLQVPVDAAGIALMGDGGGIELTVGSSPRAQELEELQLVVGEGPCVDAFSTGRLVLQADLRRTSRWPLYGPAAVDRGVSAVFSYPLLIGGIRLGVLDLYRDASGPLSEKQLSIALDFVDAALMVVLHLQAGPATGDGDGDGSGISGPMEIAFQSHPEVHQASGMIAVQADVPLADALLLLRAHAFTQDRPIVNVARDVVERRLSFR